MTWLALDVGGANLKISDGVDYASSEPFALWKAPEQLADRLAALLARAPAYDRIAVTMTGELCDCFATKVEGVTAILDAVEVAAKGQEVWVYLVGGRLASTAKAKREWRLASASNWHALASFAGRYAARDVALLLDIGSTTTDLIPLWDGQPVAKGRDDTRRLANGELVYTGVERTPLCAAVRELPYRGQMLPVAAEFFATTGDAYRCLGDAPEEPESCDTADGRARTRVASLARLARMICADETTFTDEDATAAASAIREAQLAAILSAANRVLASLASPPKTVILSGQGERLGRLVVSRLSAGREGLPAVVSLAERLGPRLSQCAPAHALAVLAREGGREPEGS